MATNPYAAIAIKDEDNPYAKIAVKDQPPTPTAQPSIMQTMGQGAADLGKGIIKGGMNTIRGIGSLESKIPGLKSLMPADVQSYLGPEGAKMNATHGTMQGIGKGIEQAGEFMVPGGAEEKLAGLAPKAVRPLARIATSALGSGAVNAAQGGSFGTGAALGAGGAAGGMALKAAAPIIAETALGIPKAARAFGKTPGKAILEETRGIRPETIAESARGRIGQLTPELEAKAAASPTPVSLLPARQHIANEMLRAESENAEGLHGQLNRMGNTLQERFGTKQAIPQDIPASDALRLKRGFGEEHTSWNPEVKNRALSAGRHAYGLLDKSIDQAVPEGAELNQRISSLMPVAKRAESVSRNAPTLQRALGRFGAHTGALTLGGIGAAGGYKEGGLPGAVAGGLTGVLAPELIASPEGQMLAARTLNRAGALRPGIGGIAQLTKRKEDEEK